MVHVEHAGHSVETETIKLVLFHPKTQVTQKEAQNLMVTIIEQPAVPLLMTALTTFMEIQVIRAIEHIESIQDILGSMAMHHIK